MFLGYAYTIGTDMSLAKWVDNFPNIVGFLNREYLTNQFGGTEWI